MLVLRLQRLGKKKTPQYRLIVSEKTKDTQAGSLEILGQYHPTEKEKVIAFKKDRIEYWLSQGAQPSNTVANLLINAGIISGGKKKSVSISNKRQGKIDEKTAKEAEAAKQKEEAAKAEAEAPVEEASAEAEETSVKEEVPAETPAEEPKAEEPAQEEKKEEPVPEAPTEEPKEEAPSEEKTEEAPAAEEEKTDA